MLLNRRGLMIAATQTPQAAGGGSTTTWNAAASSANWTLSNANLTGTMSVSGGLLLASAGKVGGATGSFQVTINAVGGGQCHVGIATTSGGTTDFVGDQSDGGLGYFSDGRIVKNGSVLTTVATYTTGDIIQCDLASDGTITVKKGVTTVYTSASGAVATALCYPAASGTGTGLQVTLNPTSW